MFNSFLKRYGSSPLLIDPYSNTLSYSDVLDLSLSLQSHLSSERSLTLILLDNSLDSVALYLSFASSNHVSFLIDSSLPLSQLIHLIDLYKPNYVVGPTEHSLFAELDYSTTIFSYNRISVVSTSHTPVLLHPKLRLLLSTSGSTGSPKAVRLSRKNVLSNALSIASYLNISSEDRAITSMPLSYTYGLSILHSHLVSGGSIVLTNNPVMQRNFWDIFKSFSVTSLSGVPYHYDIYRKIDIFSMGLSSLRYLTQAGGALSLDMSRYFSHECELNDIDFFIMYGQTEATARMSYLRPDLVSTIPTSIGQAIPGGSFSFEPNPELCVPGIEPSSLNELIYRGPNVMLGYASSIDDLSLGDELKGKLYTGDLAYKDSNGNYFISGRLSRFVKINGIRLNLKDIENIVASSFDYSCVILPQDSQLSLFVEFSDIHTDQLASNLKALLSSSLGINKRLISVSFVESFPRLPNGKLDYQTLRQS